MKKVEEFTTRNPLKRSQKFISYVEKHRIFELFQELSAMLLIKKPDDHLLFLKQSIYHAARRLDVPRLIILAPPDFDKMQLARCLVAKLDIPVISLKDIIDDTEFPTTSAFSSHTIDKLRGVLLHYMQMNYDGWIFLDFPRTDEEARCLQRAGITPSNVVDIITSETMCDSPRSKKLAEYCTKVRGLRNVFSKVIKTIQVKNQRIEDIAEKCLDFVKHREYSGRPVVFRIILIDFPDSRRGKCLGQQIAHEFNIMHVDFYDILEIISLQNTKLGDKLREARKSSEPKDLPSSLKIQVFETYILQTNSISKGWILTGLPFTLDDFKHLDMTDTPPNRVIIITDKNDNTDEETVSNSSTCRCSSDQSSTTYSSEQPSESESTMNAILDYAGATACIISDHSNVLVLRERIEYQLMRPPPCVPPRRPCKPATVRPEDVEFDPDDEPDSKVFDGIRECEPILPLV